MAHVGRSAAATAAVLVAILMAAAFPEPAHASHSTEELSGGRIGWPAFLVSESPAPSSPDDAGAIDVADAFPDAAAPSQLLRPPPRAGSSPAHGVLGPRYCPEDGGRASEEPTAGLRVAIRSKIM